jgi:hypothetical protein
VKSGASMAAYVLSLIHTRERILQELGSIPVDQGSAVRGVLIDLREYTVEVVEGIFAWREGLYALAPEKRGR